MQPQTVTDHFGQPFGGDRFAQEMTLQFLDAAGLGLFHVLEGFNAFDADAGAEAVGQLDVSKNLAIFVLI